jgi:hypothetical protein
MGRLVLLGRLNDVPQILTQFAQATVRLPWTQPGGCRNRLRRVKDAMPPARPPAHPVLGFVCEACVEMI